MDPTRTFVHVLVGALLTVLPYAVRAQTGAVPPDTLDLATLRAAAAAQDPRAVQPELLKQATDLRLAALRAQRFPQVTLSGQATLQSAVPEIPIALPDGGVPSPPHEQFRAQLEIDWMLYDGGQLGRRATAERARLAEDVAGVAVTLYALREATTEAFFGALLFDAQARTLALADDDLAARLRVAERRVEEGAALPADAAALEAELIRVRQQIDAAEADRRAALGVLAQLTGTPIASTAVLAPSRLSAEAERVLRALTSATDDDALLDRPELVRFARTAERAEAEARAREAQTRPSLSLFGQAGVGRPSPLDFLADEVAEYGLAGVRVRWPLFDGGRARREADALRAQARLAETEAAAFERRVLRDIEDERATLARLEAALEADARAVELREEVLRVARQQLDEGVLLPDTYTDRLTDLAQARLTLERHRLERAQAQARLLSALGHYPDLSANTDAAVHFD